MRVVFVGVSHWHTPLYLGPARKIPRLHLVSDPDSAVAR
jgi:hypothetical protein